MQNKNKPMITGPILVFSVIISVSRVILNVQSPCTGHCPPRSWQASGPRGAHSFWYSNSQPLGNLARNQWAGQLTLFFGPGEIQCSLLWSLDHGRAQILFLCCFLGLTAVSLGSLREGEVSEHHLCFCAFGPFKLVLIISKLCSFPPQISPLKPLSLLPPPPREYYIPGREKSQWWQRSLGVYLMSI